MRRDIKAFLTAVKALLVDTYGENPDYVYIDTAEDLVNFTGFGHGAEGGIRCETTVPMYDIMLENDFPEVPDGFFCEAINSWSFGVYRV